MLWPGACVALRSHELWGFDAPAGAWGVAMGFALVAMWCQGAIELAARWRDGGGFGDRRDARSAAHLAAHRCAYPGLARAVFLELLGVAFRVLPSWATTALTIVGGVGLPMSRAAYRCWYVTSRRRGSQFWTDLERAVRLAPGRRGVSGRRADADSGSDDDDDGGDGEDVARAFEEVVAGLEAARRAGGFGMGTVAAAPGRRTVGVGLESDERGLNALDRATARAAVGDRLGARDAAAEASEEIAAALEAVGIRAGGIARDGSRRRAGSSSAGSSSRSHWPGPVALPEWLDDETAPQHFRCPITLCVIREPATTPAGITYERAALMQWLDHQHTEPSTKQRLKRSHVVPNLTLRAMIEDWLQDAREARRRRAVAGKANNTNEDAGGESADEGVADASSRLARGTGVPLGAAAALRADRDRLRAARQRMYAALKARAATNVSAEEQRWEAIRAERENRPRRRESESAVEDGGDGDGFERRGGAGGSGGRSGDASAETRTPDETYRYAAPPTSLSSASSSSSSSSRPPSTFAAAPSPASHEDAQAETEAETDAGTGTGTGTWTGTWTGTGTEAVAEAGSEGDAASALDTTVPDASEIQSDDEREGGGDDDDDDDVRGDAAAATTATATAPTTSSSPSSSSSSMPPRVRVELFPVPDDGPAGAGTPAEAAGVDEDEDPYL